jgi:hypothetical protein
MGSLLVCTTRAGVGLCWPSVGVLILHPTALQWLGKTGRPREAFKLCVFAKAFNHNLKVHNKFLATKTQKRS